MEYGKICKECQIIVRAKKLDGSTEDLTFCRYCLMSIGDPDGCPYHGGEDDSGE